MTLHSFRCSIEIYSLEKEEAQRVLINHNQNIFFIFEIGFVEEAKDAGCSHIHLEKIIFLKSRQEQFQGNTLLMLQDRTAGPINFSLFIWP